MIKRVFVCCTNDGGDRNENSNKPVTAGHASALHIITHPHLFCFESFGTFFSALGEGKRIKTFLEVKNELYGN